MYCRTCNNLHLHKSINRDEIIFVNKTKKKIVVLFKANIQTVSKLSYSRYPKEDNIIYQDVRIRYKYSLKIYFSVNTCFVCLAKKLQSYSGLCNTLLASSPHFSLLTLLSFDSQVKCFSHIFGSFSVTGEAKISGKMKSFELERQDDAVLNNIEGLNDGSFTPSYCFYQSRIYPEKGIRVTSRIYCRRRIKKYFLGKIHSVQ